MPKYLFLILMLIAVSAFAQWEVAVEPFVAGDGCYVMGSGTIDYAFGTAFGAISGIDSYDSWLPPASPDPFMMDAYFKVAAENAARAAKDFRSADVDTLYWDFMFDHRGGTLSEVGLTWVPSELPPSGQFHIGVIIDTSTVFARMYDQPLDTVDWSTAVNMRDVSELRIVAPEAYFVHPIIRCITIATSLAENPSTPNALTLTAHPNPFNSAVEIDAPNGYIVTITDIDGRHVSTLGTGSTRWIPVTGQPSGVYLVKAEGYGENLTQSIVYMK